MYIGLHVKGPLSFSDFHEICIVSTYFQKNIQMPNFMKICPVGAWLFHADRGTSMSNLLVAFRHFAKAPKMSEPVKFQNCLLMIINTRGTL